MWALTVWLYTKVYIIFSLFEIGSIRPKLHPRNLRGWLQWIMVDRGLQVSTSQRDQGGQRHPLPACWDGRSVPHETIVLPIGGAHGAGQFSRFRGQVQRQCQIQEGWLHHWGNQQSHPCAIQLLTRRVKLLYLHNPTGHL